MPTPRALQASTFDRKQAFVLPMLGHEPARPAAVREPALGIFTGVPGSLDDPIQRYVFDDYQAPHRTTSSPTDVSPAHRSWIIQNPLQLLRNRDRRAGRRSTRCRIRPLAKVI